MFDIKLVMGSETWPNERLKVFQKFVVFNREMKSRDDEFDAFKNEVIVFKSEVMELLEQYKDGLDELKGLLHRKQTKIDSQDQEIKTLRTQQEHMAIQGMKILKQVYLEIGRRFECKSSYGGVLCDECAPEHYGYPECKSKLKQKCTQLLCTAA